MDLEIGPQAVKEKLDKKEKIVLLDVRTEREYDLCHIEGSTLMPLDKLEGLYVNLEKEDEIIVYCHHGMRSFQGAQFLVSKGFTNVKSMAGGIHLWSQEIDPTIPEY